MKTTTKTTTHVATAVLHELLKAQSYESLADLVEDLKCRLARLRITYDAQIVTDALRAVAHTRELLTAAPRPPRRLVERPPEPELFNRDEAAALCRQLHDRYVQARRP